MTRKTCPECLLTVTHADIEKHRITCKVNQPDVIKNLPSKSGKSHKWPISPRRCYVCSYCSKPYEIKIFERHEELCKVFFPYTMKKHKCGLCFKKTKSRSLLFEHFNHAHPELINNAGIWHQCSLCLNHFSIDSKAEHIETCKKLINFANMKTFSCRVCQKKCMNSIHLYTHIKGKHLEYVENPVLSLAFSKRGDLEEQNFVPNERKSI